MLLDVKLVSLAQEIGDFENGMMMYRGIYANKQTSVILLVLMDWGVCVWLCAWHTYSVSIPIMELKHEWNL